jgi:hypothetical protein
MSPRPDTAQRPVTSPRPHPRSPEGTAMPSLPDTSSRTAALWAGLGYAALFALAIFANFVVLTRLVDPGDPAATVDAIAADASLFRLGVVAFAAVFVIDIVVAWALYVIFRPAGARRSLLAAWFRLGYTVLLGAAVTFLYLALQLATGAGGTGGLDEASREALTMLALDAFDVTWLVGLVAFGAHLVLVGRMILLSGLAPRLLGAVLAIAGSAYVLDTLAHLVLADYARYADVFLAIVAVPSVVAELWFTLWLLTKARRQVQTPVVERTLEPV